MAEFQTWGIAALIIFGLPLAVSILVVNLTPPTRYHKLAYFGWMVAMGLYALALTYRLAYYLAGGWEGTLWVSAFLAVIITALYTMRPQPNKPTPEKNANAQAGLIILSMGGAFFALLLFLRIILHWLFTTPLI